MYSDLSSSSKQCLRKAIEKQASPWESVARLLRDHRTLDVGVPVAAGVGTGVYGLSQGQSPGEAALTGAGAGVLSSPAGWRNIHNQASVGRDPDWITGYLKGFGKQKAYAGVPLLAAAAVDRVPKMLRDVQDITGNVAQSSQAFAQQAPQIAQNVASTTGNISETTKNVADQSKGLMTNVNNATGNINNMARGMGEFWDPETGTIKQMIGRLDRMNDNVDQLSQSGNRTANAVANVADRISGGMDWVGKHKGAIGLGAGGVGAALLLHKLLNRDKKKHE